MRPAPVRPAPVRPCAAPRGPRAAAPRARAARVAAACRACRSGGATVARCVRRGFGRRRRVSRPRRDARPRLERETAYCTCQTWRETETRDRESRLSIFNIRVLSPREISIVPRYPSGVLHSTAHAPRATPCSPAWMPTLRGSAWLTPRRRAALRLSTFPAPHSLLPWPRR